MSMRRLTRLTNVFSKGREPRARRGPRLSLHNFVRIHRTLRITPAMSAGISDPVWSIEEIVGLLDATEKKSGLSSEKRSGTPRRFLVQQASPWKTLISSARTVAAQSSHSAPCATGSRLMTAGRSAWTVLGHWCQSGSSWPRLTRKSGIDLTVRLGVKLNE